MLEGAAGIGKVRGCWKRMMRKSVGPKVEGRDGVGVR